MCGSFHRWTIIRCNSMSPVAWDAAGLFIETALVLTERSTGFRQCVGARPARVVPWSSKTLRPVSLPPSRQNCLRSRRVLLNPVDRLPTEIGRLRDDADAPLLVEHRANEVELRTSVAPRLAAFVFDLGPLLGVGDTRLLSSLGGFGLGLRPRDITIQYAEVPNAPKTPAAFIVIG
jgi:hypothetical protein